MRHLISRFLTDDGGATAIEYGLIAAMVVVAALAALSAFGDASTGVFNSAMNQIGSAIAGG
jgi:pilus assembly protein Flp/PilA